MSVFWVGFLCGAFVVPMVLFVMLGCWTLWWSGPTRRG
jgi:hypothetical protein